MDESSPKRGGAASLPPKARAYLAALCALAAAVVAATAVSGSGASVDVVLLVVLVVLCTLGAAFEIFAPGHYALQPGFAMFVWGALVLPPWAVAVLAVASFAPGLLLRRTEHHKGAFNIANYTVSGAAAAAVASAWGGVDPVGAPGATLVVLTAGPAVATAVNHGVLLVMVALAMGERPRRMLHQLVEGAPLSLGVALTGGCLAALWTVWPPLVLAGAGPVALIARSLWVPMLRHKAETDPKTGLLNFETLQTRFAEELEAARPNGELGVVMIDLDHLRAINNRLGHLAGDHAITAAARVLAETTPDGGHAARFGGEEFCLLLPGRSIAEAEAVLETARERLRAVRLPEDPAVRITFSAGIARYPEHGESVEELTEAADRAVYDAKAAGRDRVKIALIDPAREALQIEEPGASLVSAADAKLRRLASAAAAGPAAPAAESGVRRALPRLRRSAGRRADDRVTTDVAAENARLQNMLDAQGELLGRLQRAHLDTLASLGRTIDQRDPEAMDRVTRIALRLAAALGFTSAELARVELGAAIHDIGEAGIDREDRDALRSHTEAGSELLAGLEVPVMVRQMVRSHHERYDGTGYPDGLAGEDIPLAARVLAVADALDAMLSPRAYRGGVALSVDAAAEEVKANRGTQFCPRVADALESLLGSEPQFRAELSDIRPNPLKSGARSAR